ncbi:MAG: hypothetical protein K5886_09690 [Lachnospiraceae bacterium]|nr:hypothetical protein [Lachnospiraceae bacterium]
MTGFYKKKLKALLLMVMAGSILCILTEMSSGKKDHPLNHDEIIRNGIGGTSENVSLWAVNETTDEKVRLRLTVSEQKYDTKILDELFGSLNTLLPSVIAGDNPSADHVIYDLNFVRSLDDFPFTLSYRTSDPLLLDSKGHINREKLSDRKGHETGILVNVFITCSYEDYGREISLYVRLFEDPEQGPGNRPFEELLTESVNEVEKDTRNADRFMLPRTVGNDRVSYEEVPSYNSLLIFILSLTAGILLYRREDDELKKKISKRNEQMLADYPLIINRFSLFYSVGMTTRGILLKLCRDYEQKRDGGSEKHYIYEELLRTRQLLEEGMGECAAYEDFGKRCQLHKYRQLAGLMEQTVVKGRMDIGNVLREEAEKAFTERKNQARESGEKAGTKLLLPMFMMLFTVIIIIIIPAMSAFRM